MLDVHTVVQVQPTARIHGANKRHGRQVSYDHAQHTLYAIHRCIVDNQIDAVILHGIGGLQAINHLECANSK